MEAPKTDKEIRQMALVDYIGVLESMWIAIGKPVDPARLKVYIRELADVPIGLLEPAVSAALRSTTYNVVPTVGELWAQINSILRDQGCGSVQEWNQRRWDSFMWGANSVNWEAAWRAANVSAIPEEH